MAKDTLPRVGDVVAWAKLEDFTHYTPGAMLLLVNIHPVGVFLEALGRREKLPSLWAQRTLRPLQGLA